MNAIDTASILAQFEITGKVKEVKPLGNGLINDTYHNLQRSKIMFYFTVFGCNSILQPFSL